MLTVLRTLLLLSCYDCDTTRQQYDVTRFKYVLWRPTMHEWVMNMHYQTWIAQGRFINMIRTPSKQWGVCDKHTTHTDTFSCMITQKVKRVLWYFRLISGHVFNVWERTFDLIFAKKPTTLKILSQHFNIWNLWMMGKFTDVQLKSANTHMADTPFPKICQIRSDNLVRRCHKNIEKHTAHTIVSWPNINNG